MAERDFSALISGLNRTAFNLPARSQGHLRAISAQLDAIARGDFDSVFKDAHDDVTLEISAPSEFPFVRRGEGLAELYAAIIHNFGALEDQCPQIHEVLAEGDTVVLLGSETGKIRATGKPYRIEFGERFTFRHGRLAALVIMAANVLES